MASNLQKESFDPRKEWLEYLKNRLNAIESIFNWVLIVASIVIPLLVGQLFMVVDSYIVTSSGALDLSAINLLRSGSLFGVLIVFIILVYRVGNRTFDMRKKIVEIIHSILAEPNIATKQLEDWKESYLNWRFLYDTKDGDKGAS